MSWNYRIIEYNDGSCGLHEVFYREDGSIKSVTERPCGFAGENPQELRGALMMAKMDADRRPVIKESEFEWA